MVDFPMVDDLTPTLLQIVVQLDSLIQKGNHQLFLLVYVPSYVLLGARSKLTPKKSL